MKPKDYTSNEERRLWEKRWETIKPIHEHRGKLKQLPIEKFIRGAVKDRYEAENALEFLRQEKCFKEFHVLASGMVEFIGVNKSKIMGSFSELERIYKHYAQVYESKKLDIPNKVLPKIDLRVIENKAMLFLDNKPVLGGRVTSQHLRLLKIFERLGNGKTTKIDGLYQSVVSRGHANSFEEKIEALREVCGEIQKELSSKGFTTSLEKYQDTKSVRFEISPKLGNEK